MDEDGDGSLSIVRIVRVVLVGSNLAHDDGVDALEVGRVRKNLDLDLLSIIVFSCVACSQMVLHVSGVLHPVVFLVLSGGHSLELSENYVKRLPDNVGEHIKSSSVGHADDNALGSSLDEGIDTRLHTRDEGLNSLKPEALHSVELGSNELSELVGPESSVEHLLLLGLVVGVVL